MLSAFADDSKTESLEKIRLADHLVVEWDDDRGFVVTDENEDTHRRLKTNGEKIVNIWNLGNTKKFDKDVYGYDRHILALTAENSLYVYDYQGHLKGTIDKHESDLVEILFLKERGLLTLSDDGLIGLWQLPQGKSMAVIQTNVDTADALTVVEGQGLLAQESKGTRVWDFSGNELFWLEGLKGKVRNAYRLQDRRLLIESISSGGKSHSLWDHDGSHLCTLPESIDLGAGFIELPEGKVAFPLKTGGCEVYSRDGDRVAGYDRGTELPDAIGKIANAGNELENKKTEKPSILDYEHINNPIFQKRKDKREKGVREEVEKQQIHTRGSEESQKLWDFFNRPKLRPIQKTLLKTIKNLRLERQNLDRIASEQDAEIGRLENHIKVFGVLSFIAMAAAPFTALQDPSYAVGPGAAFIVLLGVWMSKVAGLRNARRYRACVAEIRPGCDLGIKKIKDYRQSILEQRPEVRHGDLYRGDDVKEIIDRRIKSDLKQQAMDACDVTPEDIKRENQEPITLHEAAMYQDLSDFVKNRLNRHNLFSFWQASSGDVLYATQYVQFIFLGRDKIDTYVTIYDFIQGRSLDTAVQSFYYRDVTNISKREVERNVQEDKALPITLISISVSSGEAVNFCIADENTFIEQNDENQEHDNESSLEELKQEYENLKNDDELSEEEREEELSRIADMMTASWSQQSVVKAAQDTNKVADDAIRAIRSQLRHHKENSDV